MITVLRQRCPARKEIWILFLMCVFPTHVWAFIAFLRKFPAYIMRLTTVEILGVLAYTQVFILIETLVITGVLLLATIFLPRRWILDHFIPQGALLVIGCSVWITPVHYQKQLILLFQFNLTFYMALLVLWLMLIPLTVVFLSLHLRRSPHFAQGINDFIQKLGLLSGMYLLVDIFSLLFVLLRNIL